MAGRILPAIMRLQSANRVATYLPALVARAGLADFAGLAAAVFALADFAGLAAAVLALVDFAGLAAVVLLVLVDFAAVVFAAIPRFLRGGEQMAPIG